MSMQKLTVPVGFFDVNKLKFKQLPPKKILAGLEDLLRLLLVPIAKNDGDLGAQQHTRANNFLILGNPFRIVEKNKIYSEILNQEIYGRGIEPPSGLLGLHDEHAQVRPGLPHLPCPYVWEHVGESLDGVVAWYKKTSAEAKDGRILFNAHRKDAWTSLFHEPVHEATPYSGIGRHPQWIYEGYCEIIAAKLARQNGFEYAGEKSYLMWVQNTQKLIDFVSEKYFARAYFTNDEWSYGLLAPLFYRVVSGNNIYPAIPAQFLPTNPEFSEVRNVPHVIKSLIEGVNSRNGPSPKWYQRWVRLYGQSDSMPVVISQVPAAFQQRAESNSMSVPPPPPPPPLPQQRQQVSPVANVAQPPAGQVAPNKPALPHRPAPTRTTYKAKVPPNDWLGDE